MNVLLLIGTSILVLSAWVLHCNSLTFKQRKKLRNLAFDQKDLDSMEIILSVDYDIHMWYLITFRNPQKLYKRNQ
mgnify:CR=1 FL=1